MGSIFLWHAALDRSVWGRRIAETFLVVRMRFGDPEVEAGGLVHLKVKPFCGEMDVGRCDGTLAERDQEQLRDILSEEQSHFYKRLHTLGYAAFPTIPIAATGYLAPLRRGRVLPEAQMMRACRSSLITRGFATMGALEAQAMGKGAELITPRKPKKRPVMRLRGVDRQRPGARVQDMILPRSPALVALDDRTESLKLLMRFSRRPPIGHRRFEEANVQLLREVPRPVKLKMLTLAKDLLADRELGNFGIHLKCADGRWGG